MTQAQEFVRHVREITPQGSALNYRTVHQLLAEFGAVADGAFDANDFYKLPDGSRLAISGLHSGFAKYLAMPAP